MEGEYKDQDLERELKDLKDLLEGALAGSRFGMVGGLIAHRKALILDGKTGDAMILLANVIKLLGEKIAMLEAYLAEIKKAQTPTAPPGAPSAPVTSPKALAYYQAPSAQAIYSRAEAACKNTATASRVPARICAGVKAIQEKRGNQGGALIKKFVDDVVITCMGASPAGPTSAKLPADIAKRICGGITKWTPPPSVVLTTVRKAIALIPSAAAMYKKLKPGDRKILEQYLTGAKGCGYSKTQAPPLAGSGFEPGKPSIVEMCRKIMDLIKKPKGVIQITEPTEAGMKKPEFIETKSPATQPATPATQPQAPTPTPADAPATGGSAAADTPSELCMRLAGDFIVSQYGKVCWLRQGRPHFDFYVCMNGLWMDGPTLTTVGGETLTCSGAGAPTVSS